MQGFSATGRTRPPDRPGSRARSARISDTWGTDDLRRSGPSRHALFPAASPGRTIASDDDPGLLPRTIAARTQIPGNGRDRRGGGTGDHRDDLEPQPLVLLFAGSRGRPW